jgi:hypothetical protein
MSPEYALKFEIAQLVVSSLTLVSVFVAFLAYRASLRKQEEDRVREADRELLGQAQNSLEWAYDSLTDKGASSPPRPDRLNWLTSARHLLRHSKIAKRIQSDTYKIVHAEHEEYWRHRFYLVLNHNSLLSSGYYENSETQPWPENIEVSSALVVISFSNWPKEHKDPTDEVDRAAILNDTEALKGRAGRGLRAYAARLAEAKAKMNASSS